MLGMKYNHSDIDGMKDCLDGHEFFSDLHEGIVGVADDQVLRFGLVLESGLKPAMVEYLFASMFEDEFGGPGPSVGVYDAARAISEYVG